MIKITIVLILIIFIYKLRKKQRLKALNKGEQEVINILNKIKGYKLLNNIMIKNDKGTSQIDHILIGKKGIFVIETKDFNGIIYGDKYSKYWTQILNKTNNKFYNPIRQNYGHIKALEKCIKTKGIFISVIVFTNKSQLKEIKTNISVIQLKELKGFIKKYKSDKNLSVDEINKIYNLIKKSNIYSNRARRKHIKRIMDIS